MKVYADTPGLRARQVLGDALAVVWVALWVVVARLVRSLLDSLASPVTQLRGTGVTLRDAMTEAAHSAADVPLVGDKLVGPLDKGAGAGTTIIHTSDSLVARIHEVALWTSLLVGAVPIVLGLAWWFGRRLAFMRTASTTQRFVDADADLDLFALRAMASQPLSRLDAVSHDPVGAWRRRDVDVIRALAAMELADAGLRMPARTAVRSAGAVTAPGAADPGGPVDDRYENRRDNRYDEPYEGPASRY